MAQIQLDVASGVGGSKMTDGVVRTAGSSIGASAVRVTIDDTNALSKSEVLRALKAIEDFVTGKNWPSLT